jgi:acetoin utilization protein AcuB
LLAKELITDIIPVLKPEDKGQTALNLMDTFRVSHLPVVKEDEYLGLISDKFIYDLNLNEEVIDKHIMQLHTPHIHENQHIVEAASVMYKLGVTVLPVVNDVHTYKGCIILPDISREFARMLSLDEPGGVIILNIPDQSYSLSQISQIVESNDTRLLSLFALKPVNSDMLQVTIKLNKVDLSGVIRTFERYDYQIASVFMDDSMLHDLYEDRLEQFIRYLNI